MKQSELAKLLKITGNTISNWENNVSKPDLDTLSYLCGILHVSASYFLQPTIPEDEVSITELNMIKKYRSLDSFGQETVNIALDRESTRAEQLREQEAQIPDSSAPVYTLNAAHERTDIEVTDEMRQQDDDTMNDDSQW